MVRINHNYFYELEHQSAKHQRPGGEEKRPKDRLMKEASEQLQAAFPERFSEIYSKQYTGKEKAWITHVGQASLKEIGPVTVQPSIQSDPSI